MTATKTGYTAVKALSAATDPVAPGPDAVDVTAGRSTVEPVPGATLRLGSISGRPGRVEERCAGSRDYARVPGATASTYRLTAADLGHRIRAVVYLDRPGYQQMVLRTALTRVVRATPVLRVSTTPGAPAPGRPGHRARPWLPNFNGTLQVRSPASSSARCRCATALPRATVTGLPIGTRTYRFRARVHGQEHRRGRRTPHRRSSK